MTVVYNKYRTTTKRHPCYDLYSTWDRFIRYQYACQKHKCVAHDDNREF